MLVSNSFTSELLSEFCCTNQHYDAVVVKCSNIIFCVCYRPPSGNYLLFLSYLDSLLEFVNDSNYQIVLGGDLNINMITQNKMKLELESLLNIHLCQNVITSPTRVTATCETALDLFLTNFDVSSVKPGVLVYAISDHLPVFIFIATAVEKQKQVHQAFSYRLVNTNTLSAFGERLASATWDDVYGEKNADAAYDKFMQLFMEIYYECFPVKTLRQTKKCRKPWIDKHLLKLINKRDRLYGSFMETKSPEALKAFKEYRNYVTKQLRVAKKHYYFNLFNSSAGRPDKIWRTLASVTGTALEKTTTVLKDGNELKGVDLANAFNDFFCPLVRHVMVSTFRT